MGTTKRQLSFYAEADVDLYLELLSPGSKTRSINDAIRQVMGLEAKVSLSDDERPTYFNDLPEDKQKELEASFSRPDRNLLGVDDQVWHAVQETPSRNWRLNVCRYLALHEAKFGVPLKITDTLQKPQTKPLKLVARSATTANSCTVTLHVSVGTNSKNARVRKKAMQSIELYCLSGAGIRKVANGQWELKFSYKSEEDLDRQVQALLEQICFQADLENCSVELSASEKDGQRRW